MVVCVECGSPVEALYKEVNREDIRLVSCTSCHHVADKYIEWEIQIVLIDLILQRPQAYRHILFNRSMTNRRTREVFKFLTVILAFDSFDRWYLNSNPMRWPSAETVLSSPVSVFTQWLLPHENQWSILMTAMGETSVYIATIFLLIRMYLFRVWGQKPYNSRTLLSAIVLSCYSKMGVMLYMVFDATVPHRFAIAIITLLSNIAAVGVFMGKKSPSAIFPILVIGIALLARLGFAYAMSTVDPTIRFSII
jgi:lipid intermediate transporter